MTEKEKVTVLVNGQPVKNYIKEEESQIIGEEAKEIFFSTVEEIKKILPKSQETLKFPIKSVCSRPTKLTDGQIRKEYGLMSKPYKSLGENILWALAHNGPSSITEIRKKLDMEGKNLQTTIDRLRQKLPNEIEIKGENPRKFVLVSKLTTEELYKLYRSRLSLGGRKQTESIPEIPQKDVQEVWGGLQTQGGLSIPENINITVTVRGELKILFSFSS